MLQMLYDLKITTDELAISNKIISKEMVKLISGSYDPNFVVCSSVRDPDFRKTLVTYYPSCRSGDLVKCQVTGIIEIVKK